MIRIEVRGVERISRALGDVGALSDALEAGLLAGAIVVERAAKMRVHSPDNPYIGKAGRNVATGRLQASIGTSDVRGAGLAKSVRVGTPYGRTGAAGSTFARSSASEPRGRTGGRRNTGDPNVYGPIEERRHPFLEPSVTENEDEIVSAVARRIGEVLEERLR